MRLLDAIPRQPTRRDIDDCDRQIEMWRCRRVDAVGETPWAVTCDNIVDYWLDLRAEIAAALNG
jgi:hypothetical protein